MKYETERTARLEREEQRGINTCTKAGTLRAAHEVGQAGPIRHEAMTNLAVRRPPSPCYKYSVRSTEYEYIRTSCSSRHRPQPATRCRSRGSSSCLACPHSATDLSCPRPPGGALANERRAKCKRPRGPSASSPLTSPRCIPPNSRWRHPAAP